MVLLRVIYHAIAAEIIPIRYCGGLFIDDYYYECETSPDGRYFRLSLFAPLRVQEVSRPTLPGC